MSSSAESQTLLSRLELANGSAKDTPALHGYDSVDKALNLEVGEVQAPDESPTTHWFRFVTNDSIASVALH